MKTSTFQSTIWNYFKDHKRILPWRYETDPYKILVSEVMLQQTQVSRVIPKYKEWLEKFPTVESLANASLRDVLVTWQGLGYNRRGKFLKEAVEKMTKDEKYGFMIPPSHPERTVGAVEGFHEMFRLRPDIRRDSAQHDREEADIFVNLLEELPGIGHATASAIVAYSFNKPVVFIETNIRAVYLYSFYNNAEKVSDKQITELVTETLDYDNSREWYYALTDYGNMLKNKEKFKNTQSKHYTKQSKFEGSRRQLRAQILFLVTHQDQTLQDIIESTKRDGQKIKSVLEDLIKEQLIIYRKKTYRLTNI